MSEDPEIAKIMQKKLDAMINQKPEPKIEPGIIDLNSSNFDQIISAETPTLVDFWAEWCGPCKVLGPIVDDVAPEFDGKVKFTKLDIDANPATAPKYGIRGIPTIMVFKNGELAATSVGVLTKSELTNFLNENL